MSHRIASRGPGLCPGRDTSPLVMLIERVTLIIAKWALVRKEFSNFSINCIFVNWKACMVCGSTKVRRPTLSFPPPLAYSNSILMELQGENRTCGHWRGASQQQRGGVIYII